MRSAAITATPSWSNRRATACPIPLAAPVTTARLPLPLISTSISALPFPRGRQAGILTEGYGLGVCLSDLDDNGWPDVYCANDFLSNDLVWMNRSAATGTPFQNRAAAMLNHQTHNGMGVDIADIHHDARALMPQNGRE